jgi:hypothetical protein
MEGTQKERLIVKSVARALFGISTTSSCDHAYGVTRDKKRGGKSILSLEEELEVVQWIIEIQSLGHPISIILRTKVVNICETCENPFTNGIPS